MNPEISKLEAALLNLDETRLPLLSKINEYNSLAAAETSRRLVGLPGAERVMVKVVPHIYTVTEFIDGISVECSGKEKIDLEKMKELASKVQKEYAARKSPIIDKMRDIAFKEDILQKKLCEYTVIIPVKDDHPHSHAYLFVVREDIIYISHVKYEDGAIFERAVKSEKLLPSLKSEIDCNKFEVTHPSRLAAKNYMTAVAASHVSKKARAKQS